MPEFLLLLLLQLADAVAWLSPRNRSPDGSLRDVAMRHPKSTVRAARMLTWPLDDGVGAERVRFVVADRRGLSFRDAYDYEELRIPFAEHGDGEPEVLDALHAAFAHP